MDKLQFQGFVWLFACRASYVLSSEVHYLWHYSQLIVVIVTIFCLRLVDNFRRIPIYLTGRNDVASDSIAIYGYYRHHLLDLRWNSGLISGNDKYEMEE